MLVFCRDKHKNSKDFNSINKNQDKLQEFTSKSPFNSKVSKLKM